MSEIQYAHNTRRRGDERQPTGWATYSGKAYPALCRHLTEGHPMGPNYMGELMWPVQVVYDPDEDTTRAGFSLMPPTDEQATS
jgi:hypothetical protein